MTTPNPGLPPRLRQRPGLNIARKVALEEAVRLHIGISPQSPPHRPTGAAIVETAKAFEEFLSRPAENPEET